ncbi:MAG: type II secretion system F family protein [Clostridia bacterium]|nr:type II secretion system F family protein [Clostridia bacterium]
MTDTSQANVMKRLKDNGLTPINVKLSRNILSQSARPEKKNQVTSATVSRLNEQMEQARAKKKVLKQDVQIPFLKFGSGVKYEEILAFTQNFHLLKKAGFTNVRALTTLLENTQNPYLREIIADILNGIESGEYIYSTMEHYPKVFSPLYINIIKVGEMSDSLADSLAQALKSLEDNRDIKRKVRKAIMQPAITILALIIMSIVAVVYGLPVMKNLYTELGVEDQIPAATLAFANFVEVLGHYWYISAVIIAGLIAAFITWYRTPNGRFAVDKFKYTMPIFGQLMIRLDLQKFLRAMQLNLENNAKLDESMEVSKSVIKNYLFLAIVESAQNNLSQGLSWVEPFEQYEFMPSMTIEMLKIGMETDIKSMMYKITDYISQDIEITMARIMATIPQVSMAIAGVFIIAFMIIVLKPIMEVYMGNFLFDAYGI